MVEACANRWLLVVVSDDEAMRSAVATHIASETGASIVELLAASSSGGPASRDQSWPDMMAEAAERTRRVGRLVVAVGRRAASGPSPEIEFEAWNAALPVYELRLTSASIPTPDPKHSDDGRTVTIDAASFTPEQIVALLRPVLVGPRPVAEIGVHVSRRLRLFELGGRIDADAAIVGQIRQHIDRDRSNPEMLDRWSLSTIVDENTQRPVIEQSTFEWVLGHETADARSRWPVGHAGLLHTYGYLFSAAWTPYGWKADRYLDGTLALLLGLGLDDITPWAPNGTMLSNLTLALDRLVAHGSPRYVVDEVGDLRAADGSIATGTLRTRIFPPVAGGDHHLLIYSVAPDDGGERLVTAFPIRDASLAGVIDAADCRGRYNVAVSLVNGVRVVR